MTKATAACAECGASGRLGACIGLFYALLALDHERKQPWGRFHGVNVACFMLQHPSMTSSSAHGGQWQIVATFLSGGLGAANALEAAHVEANRRGKRLWMTVDAPSAPSTAPTVTIEDVAVDGTFPAIGYEDRVHAWASAVVAQRVTV
jgi:hypothetical protein